MWCTPTVVSSTFSRLDREEDAPVGVGQRLVAVGRAAPDAPERGQDQARRVELEDGRQVVEGTRLVAVAARSHADAPGAAVPSRDPYPDRPREALGSAEVGRGLPDDEHEGQQE